MRCPEWTNCGLREIDRAIHCSSVTRPPKKIRGDQVATTIRTREKELLGELADDLGEVAEVAVVSALVAWLHRQNHAVRNAVYRSGLGKKIDDEAEVARQIRFGAEQSSRASSSSPQDTGRRARPAA